MNREDTILIRHATLQDLEEISAIENACFPASQACSKKQFQERLAVYPEHFWILEKDRKILSFADGFCTHQKELTEEMYEKAALHDETGPYQMIFGVNTLPEYRKKGYASLLLRHIIDEARTQGRKGVILTCLKEKIPFYSQLGFELEGISVSVHGDVQWYQMIRRL